jgi:hypothetical protein
MCCGQKREALRNSAGIRPAGAADGQAGAESLYYLRNVPARLRASLTGRPAEDSGQRPMPIDPSKPGVRR